jgi:DNA-binding transcriptional MerR regulator
MTARNTKRLSPTQIPDKLYFRIGDVARLLDVEPYVLRFWETEFPQLKPGKSGTGQRLYRKRDVELALRIKHLLYEKGYTIAGARQVFKGETKASANQADLPLQRLDKVRLEKMRTELNALLDLLSEGKSHAATSTRPKPSSGEKASSVHKLPGPGLF